MDAIITRYEHGIDIVFNSLYNGTSINAKREFFHYTKYRFYLGMAVLPMFGADAVEVITIKDSLGNLVNHIRPEFFANCNAMNMEEFYDYLMASANLGCKYAN